MGSHFCPDPHPMSEDDENFPFYAKGKTPSAALSPYPESKIEKMRMEESNNDEKQPIDGKFLKNIMKFDSTDLKMTIRSNFNFFKEFKGFIKNFS